MRSCRHFASIARPAASYTGTLSGCRRFAANARHHGADSLVPNVTTAEVNSSRQHCLNLLQRLDAPSFTLQAFIPPTARDAYIAIRTFNIDVAGIADQTSHAAIGSMRMQFWREVVGRSLTPDTTPRKEPVAILLAHAAATLRERTNGATRLSPIWFNNVITAREARLSDPPYVNLDALERYAEATYSSLMYATLAALPMQSLAADHVASHIGKATGIAAVLRGLPLLAFPQNPGAGTQHTPSAIGGHLGQKQRQGSVLLPLDIMAEHGVREEDVLREGGSANGLRDAVFDVATRANDHLITAQELLKSFSKGKEADHEFEHAHEEGHGYSPNADPSEVDAKNDVEQAFGVFMQAVPTSMWLQKLQKADFDIFDPQLRAKDWKLPWRAFWAFSRRKI